VPVGTAPSGNRILVLVTLYGGNDGLNTVIPYADPAYYQLRGAIGIPESQVLQIGEGFGLHPSLVGTKALWDAGNVAIVRGVGYPDPNLSHFTSMDIWQSAVPQTTRSPGGSGAGSTARTPIRSPRSGLEATSRSRSSANAKRRARCCRQRRPLHSFHREPLISSRRTP